LNNKQVYGIDGWGIFYQPDINKYLNLHNVNTEQCLDCKISKLKRKPHNKITPMASTILEVIHSDLIGPIQPISIDDMKYILTFNDEFSCKSWIYLLKEKSETVNTILYFLKYVENHHGNKIKIF